MRLGVSPTAASTPTGVFNRWFEALFPCAGTLGCAVCHQVHQLPATLASCSFARPTPQSTTSLGPPAPPLPRILSTWLPTSTPPVTGCSQEGGPKQGFVMGVQNSRCPGNTRKIYIGCPYPHKSELGEGTHGAGPLRAVLYSNSCAANLWHGHLTYL